MRPLTPAVRNAFARRPGLPGRLRGFTLIEVMVVMLIIAIIIGFATLAIGPGGRDKQVENQARRLAALIDLASDQAVMRSEELAIQLDETSYRFMRLAQAPVQTGLQSGEPSQGAAEAYREGFGTSYGDQNQGFGLEHAQPVQKWLPIQDDNLLRRRTLPEGLSMVLKLDDLSLTMKVDKDDEENEKPMVFLLSSGEMTPFELIVAAEESALRYTIKGGAFGDLELKPGHD